MRPTKRSQAGFTLIELMITTCIVAILGSIALAQYRDYTRRAKISEIVVVATKCKNAVAEGYLTLDRAPSAGGWGCETTAGTTYGGAVQTSADGAIRVSINNLDRLVNGQYVYLVPARLSGTQMFTPNDLGRGVTTWICGSDWQPVRNALPSSCRTDTTTYTSGDFN